MKRPLLIFLFLFTFASIFQKNTISQEWKWVNPVPQGNTLRWVKAITPTLWVAAGNNSTFIKTTNAGITWDIKTNAGKGKDIQSGWFFNASTGLLCGAAGWIGRTTNGGTSWDSLTYPRAVIPDLFGMHFINTYTGFIAGTLGTVLKTTNSGLNWDTVSTGVTNNLYNVYALDVNHIYAPSNFGVILTTTNGGTNWVRDSVNLSYPLNAVFFINKNTGIACGYYGSIFKTTNAGLNWTSKIITQQILHEFYASYVQPVISYSQNFDSIVFPPAGWRAVNIKGSNVWVRSTAQSNSYPASALMNYNCDTSGGLDWLISPQIHVSPGDSLAFWIRTVSKGFIPDSLCVRVSTTDTALSSFTNRILYIAEGAGYPDTAKWGRFTVSLNQFANQNIYIGFKHQDYCGVGIYLDDFMIGPNPDDMNAVIYAVGDSSKIYRSFDIGNNWTPIPILEPQQYTYQWYSMDINGSTMVTAGYGGIFNASTNNGLNWSAKNYRFAKNTLYDVWCEYGTGKFWAVGSPEWSGVTCDQVVYSPDGGYTFQNQYAGNPGITYNCISMVNANTGYICGTKATVRKTTNGGFSWDSVYVPLATTLNLSRIDFVNALTGWVFVKGVNAMYTIVKTTNGGISWELQTTGDTSTNGQKIDCADMVNAETGYCVNYYNIPYKTTNGGLNWIQQSLPGVQLSSYINDIFMLNSNSGYVCGSAPGRLYKTTNGGTKWDSVSIPSGLALYTTSWYDMYNGIVAGQYGIICSTTDGGSSWNIFTGGSGTYYGSCIRTMDTMYVVSTGGSIMKVGRGPVSITWTPKIPVKFFLGQNYPNPFNPSTTIKFGLKTKSAVSLKVYDITGRLVKSYFDKTDLNAGTVTIRFDGTEYASGVYFYSLYVNDERIDTKKMVLVK